MNSVHDMMETAILAKATVERRGKLRDALIDIAEAKISANGLRALTARDVASAAGCAVGAIYGVFKDMDALAAAVNSRTAVRLEQAVGEAFARDGGGEAPKRQLVLLGLTYLSFVAANPRLWAAIFELRPGDAMLSDAQHEENSRLMKHVVTPLGRILPNESEERLLLIARGLFSAVHGIVMLGQNGRFTVVPADRIAVQITFIVEGFCDGVAARPVSLKA